MTSLAFMFDDVPEPVWKTSIGNWSSCSPAATASPAARDALGELAVEQAEVGVHARRSRLDAPEPAHDADRDRPARDREVVDRLACLGAPQLTHAPHRRSGRRLGAPPASRGRGRGGSAVSGGPAGKSQAAGGGARRGARSRRARGAGASAPRRAASGSRPKSGESIPSVMNVAHGVERLAARRRRPRRAGRRRRPRAPGRRRARRRAGRRGCAAGGSSWRRR